MLKLITLDEPNSIHAEMYRSIRTNLEYTSIDKIIKVYNITSTVANEAKTTTACNMAIMSANKNKRVLLIDLDLRNPSIHRAFTIKNQSGITDMLIDFMKNGENIDINQYTQLIKHNNIINQLYVIPVGTEVINPTEILSSKKIKELINFLKKDFDEVIIDSSPSGIITDGVITSTIADGTVFVVENGKTKIDIAKKTIDQLKNVGVNILGVVLTKVKYSQKRYGYYEYGYGKNKDTNDNRIKIDIE
ncbi:CpsD/CapB family tyrosine-protein kinase [Mycoplasmatota bacterium]|nr:CpsD/CapB family tyrosine-protein kinase [Mycoplasmatota bacterium]